MFNAFPHVPLNFTSAETWLAHSIQCKRRHSVSLTKLCSTLQLNTRQNTRCKLYNSGSLLEFFYPRNPKQNIKKTHVCTPSKPLVCCEQPFYDIFIENLKLIKTSCALSDFSRTPGDMCTRIQVRTSAIQCTPKRAAHIIFWCKSCSEINGGIDLMRAKK